MGKIIRFFAFVVTVFLIFQSPVSANAEMENGNCGENSSFSMSKVGTLVISGNGKVTKYFSDDKNIKAEQIQRIVVEEGITELGNKCFAGLTEVKEITLPTTLQGIGEGAFQQCAKIKEVKIPDSVVSIGEFAFDSCAALKEIWLPQDLKKTERALCANCINLSAIHWPQKLQVIGYASFSGCNSLQTVKIPDAVKRIESYAFSSCENLQILMFGTSVEKVAKSYAKNSIALRKVVNYSDISIPLVTSKGNLIWRLDGQRVEVLPPKKTARAEAKKYLIQYKLKGGKIKGRRINKHEYGKAMKLPSLYRKGYRFLGWHIYYNKDWHYYQMEIKPNANGKIVAEAVFKQIKISAENQRIQVMVKDPDYGKRNYLKEMDNYYFRYSENPDMSNSTWVFSTTPYGKGISKKLKKGRVYYVQIAERTLGFEEEDDDMWNPTLGWLIKKKIRMK